MELHVILCLETNSVFLGEVQTFVTFQRKDRRHPVTWQDHPWASRYGAEGGVAVFGFPMLFLQAYHPEQTQGAIEGHAFPLPGHTRLPMTSLAKFNVLTMQRLHRGCDFSVLSRDNLLPPLQYLLHPSKTHDFGLGNDSVFLALKSPLED